VSAHPGKSKVMSENVAEALKVVDDVIFC